MPRQATSALVAALTASASVEAGDGYAFRATYTGEFSAVVSGGLATGSRYLDNLDLKLDVDVRSAFGTGAGRVFLYGLYNNGATFADVYVGDLQVNSNIDAPEAVRLFEAWYEYAADAWSVRAGLYDLNSEFDAHQAGSLFLNSSHGIGAEFAQAGQNGPSIFPISSLAVRLDWQGERFNARVGVFDGVPGDPGDPSSNEISLGDGDGALVVAEGGVGFGKGGRLWAGYWRYTADYERFSGGLSDNNAGWYAGAEYDFAIADRNVALFLRYGQANESLNPLADYVGAGVVLDGVMPGRAGDRLGLAVASAGAGHPYRQAIAGESRETTWELSYRARFNEHFALQPDIQYVMNPAADPAIDNALILALRFELSY